MNYDFHASRILTVRNIIAIDLINTQKELSVPASVQNEWRVLLCVKGSQTVVAQDARLEIRQKETVILSSGLETVIENGRDSSYILITFCYDYGVSLFRILSVIPVNSGTEGLVFLEQIIRTAFPKKLGLNENYRYIPSQSDSFGTEQLIIRSLEQYLIISLREGINFQTETTGQNPGENFQHMILIERINTYIRENISEDLSVEHIARKFNYSRQHLSLLYKSLSGSNLNDVIIDEKLRKAKSLLGESTLSISQISDSLGYSSPQYFSRIFNKKLGFTPSHYRRSISSDTMDNQIIGKFITEFHHSADYLFSAPGRVELGGNHTDHQHGLVLAAAVNLDTRAAVSINGTDTIRLISEGYPGYEISLSDLTVKQKEMGTTAALIRGIAAGFALRGTSLHGFDAYVCSSVIPGGGLSSSASFEILIGTIINHLFCDDSFLPLDIALIGKYAENEYYGKPCGLMDQMACAYGGVLEIDFNDVEKPLVTPVDFAFDSCGYKLCIIDTGADHHDLTDDYSAITKELATVCSVFGKQWLREIPEETFFEHIPDVMQAAGDRALLRAIHVYEENKRVVNEMNALLSGDFEAFLQNVRASGASSWQYLQNVIPCGNSVHQEMASTIAIVSHILADRGACRVQGGGFAGSIQAYVPEDMLAEFSSDIEKYFGPGKLTTVSIRPFGGKLISDMSVPLS